MIIHNVVQGSAEWHELRANHRTASEAPVMAGLSKLQTRLALLDSKKTVMSKEVSFFTQRIFDKGHAVEDLARVIVEKMLGEELFPIVGTRGAYLASMDGANLMCDTLFEHKQWNEELAAAVRAKELDPQYWMQLEQQLYVSGAERVIFVCSDGTEENMVWMEYRAVPGRWEQIAAGWDLFMADLSTHVVTEAKPKVVAEALTELPSLSIVLSGEVKSSNLVVYKDFALQFVESINTDLQNDQDFANAEAAVKFCEKAEKELEFVKKSALSQTASLSEVLETIDSLKEAMRAKRLVLDKLVKTRKEAIRLELKQNADAELGKHIESLNQNLRTVRLPSIPADFAGAMKGKRSIDSLKNAIDGEMVRAKGEASRIYGLYAENLTTLETNGVGFSQLFTDVQQLVTKSNDDLVLLINARIAEHQRIEQERQDQIKAEALRLEQQRLETQRLENERVASQATCEPNAPAEEQPSLDLGNPAPAAVTSTARMSAVAQASNTVIPPVSRSSASSSTRMVTIADSEYQRLLASERKLHALQAGGVDNWVGYSDAMSELEAA